ncbi:uncharacterized protein LOC117305704 [Asterias rubens]|uniref:uncharacterized protein LOC117305704 n=1 Tax=Asterias rubens TaxID=7604 RepID=UPI001455AF9A|nr:uncharacterized protein LOC117305704 [Asterias rubens]
MTCREVENLQFSLTVEERDMFVQSSSSRRTRQEKKDEGEETGEKRGGKGKRKGKGKGKGKARLPTSKDPARMDRLLQEENSRLRAAIRSSMEDAGMRMGRSYRALVETSESEEEAFLDQAVAAARGSSPFTLAAECGGDSFEAEDSFETGEDSVDEPFTSKKMEKKKNKPRKKTPAPADSYSSQTGGDSFETGGDEGECSVDVPPADSCSSQTEGEEGEDSIEPPTSSKKKQKKKKKKQTPAPVDSDDDPDPPSAYQRDYAPDDQGWTRHLENIQVHSFKGRKPRGPTFGKKSLPVKYFLKFFPLLLLTSIVKWTNTKLKARRLPLTSLPEVKAWFGIHMLMGLVRINNYKDYWASHLGLRNTLISNTMKRHRFDTISEHLACADPSKDPDLIRDKAHRYSTKKKHPLYPLQSLWDKVRHACLKLFNPD